MAVLAHGELTEFRVRTFYGAWSEEKRSDILRTIKKAVERYEITGIVVKAPKPTHCSDSILGILQDIEQLAGERDIKLRFCTIADLTKLYSEDERSNKRQLIHAICKKYPNHKQLAELCAKESTNKNAYHVKVFEAIACAELALKAEQ